MYSDIVLKHFHNPKNLGKIENADGVGNVGNEICGDTITLYIKVKDDVIEDVKFETLGCAAAIASSSAFTEMVKGKKIEDALKVTSDDVIKALGGLPEYKTHCSMMAEEALSIAIKSYREK
ncbi:iron-sulfur cluster assembly scaffold protein [bacterium]|nr:MAG: iron-sulfur cluster assembly scaffold protein [bacterium]